MRLTVPYIGSIRPLEMFNLYNIHESHNEWTTTNWLHQSVSSMFLSILILAEKNDLGSNFYSLRSVLMNSRMRTKISLFTPFKTHHIIWIYHVSGAASNVAELNTAMIKNDILCRHWNDIAMGLKKIQVHFSVISNALFFNSNFLRETSNVWDAIQNTSFL